LIIWAINQAIIGTYKYGVIKIFPYYT